MSDRLRSLLEDGQAHVMDGAMGTVLYARGMFVNVCYDELNVTHSELVREVHELYVRAGAEIIETNTFGANPVKLSAHGLENRTEELNRVAAVLACDTAGARASVAGSVGPLGIRIEPFGPTAREEATAFFGRQVRGLLDGGVEGFVLETFGDLDELHAALQAVRQLSDLPVFALMTIDEAGATAYGTDAEKIAHTVGGWDVDVIGLNCSVGPAVMLDALERMREATDRPLAALPNAGLPRVVGDRKIYLSSPEYFANYAARMVRAGVRFVGGCCGTTHEHIKKIHEVVAATHPRRHPVVMARQVVAATAAAEPAALSERSALGRKLTTGGFVTNVELAPSRGWNPEILVSEARALKAIGVDTVSLLDGPRARGAVAAIPAAATVQRDANIETLVHYTCRDRNMLGMVSDMLGAAAAGIRNVLLVTGDPPRAGPYRDATAVLDIDSIGLTNVVYRLNHGLDPGGNAIGEPTRFVIGVAVNPTAVDQEQELRRLYWKVDAGADFIATQPVFEPGPFLAFLRRIAEYRVPVIAGIWPLLSLRRAEFLANEVPGQSVPAAVLDRMRRAEERGADSSVNEGIAIARETIAEIRPHVRGIHLSVPRGGTDLAEAILSG